MFVFFVCIQVTNLFTHTLQALGQKLNLLNLLLTLIQY